MSHPYLISKIADPIFALLIGSSSAVLRIQRDMREEIGGSQTQIQKQSEAGQADQARVQQRQQLPEVKLSEIWQIGTRRVGMWWRGEFSGL